MIFEPSLMLFFLFLGFVYGNIQVERHLNDEALYLFIEDIFKVNFDNFVWITGEKK